MRTGAGRSMLATDLAVGVRIPHGEHHRVQGCSSSPAGARLTPGTGRQPRLRGQRRQRQAGNADWTTPGEARPEQAPLALEQRGERWRSGVVTWAPSTAAAELHGDYCGSAGRAGGHLPPGRRAPPPRERPGGAEPYSCLTLGRHSLPTLPGPPYSFLASRWRRLRCDRRATPSVEPPTRPTARVERGVPARAGTRDRPVPARGPGAATDVHVDGLAAFQVAQRRPIAAPATAPPLRRAHVERRDAHPHRVVATDGHPGRGPAPPVS